MKILFTIFLLASGLFLLGCSSSSQMINISELEYPNDLKVMSRADWGWQSLDRVLPKHTINKITIHHGGEEFAEDKDIIQYLNERCLVTQESLQSLVNDLLRKDIEIAKRVAL